MKVVYFIDNLRADGAQQALRQLVEGLAARGHRQKVVCLNDSWDDKLLSDLRSVSDEVRIVGKQALMTGYGLIATKLWLARENCDAVVTMLFVSDVIGRFLANWAKVPRIISSLRARNVHYSAFQRALVRSTMDWADAVVINSPHTREFAVTAEGVNAHRIYFIPNGVDIDKFRKSIGKDDLAREFNLPTRGFLLGCVARLTKQKGIDILLRALSIIGATDANLIIFGIGEEEVSLRAFACQLSLQSRVSFAGYRYDIPRLLGALDLYVHPARFEGMPNAVIEAMAAGCPVVATNTDGARELINQGEQGWLVPPNDPVALASAIGEALADRDEARRRAVSAQRRVAEHFTTEKMIRSWEEILSREQVLA